MRYDGGDKEQPELIAAIQQQCEILPVCPEVEAGLGIPRPPVRLVKNSAQPHMAIAAIGRDDPTFDITTPLQLFSTHFCKSAPALSGMILQNRSPSCGIDDTPYYSLTGVQQGLGDGLFTATVRNAYPTLPLASPQQLSSPTAIAHFLAQVKRGHSRGAIV